MGDPLYNRNDDAGYPTRPTRNPRRAPPDLRDYGSATLAGRPSARSATQGPLQRDRAGSVPFLGGYDDTSRAPADLSSPAEARSGLSAGSLSAPAPGKPAVSRMAPRGSPPVGSRRPPLLESLRPKDPDGLAPFPPSPLRNADPRRLAGAGDSNATAPLRPPRRQPPSQSARTAPTTPEFDSQLQTTPDDPRAPLSGSGARRRPNETVEEYDNRLGSQAATAAILEGRPPEVSAKPEDYMDRLFQESGFASGDVQEATGPPPTSSPAASQSAARAPLSQEQPSPAYESMAGRSDKPVREALRAPVNQLTLEPSDISSLSQRYPFLSEYLASVNVTHEEELSRLRSDFAAEHKAATQRLVQQHTQTLQDLSSKVSKVSLSSRDTERKFLEREEERKRRLLEVLPDAASYLEGAANVPEGPDMLFDMVFERLITAAEVERTLAAERDKALMDVEELSIKELEYQADLKAAEANLKEAVDAIKESAARERDLRGELKNRKASIASAASPNSQSALSSPPTTPPPEEAVATITNLRKKVADLKKQNKGYAKAMSEMRDECMTLLTGLESELTSEKERRVKAEAELAKGKKKNAGQRAAGVGGAAYDAQKAATEKAELERRMAETEEEAEKLKADLTSRRRSLEERQKQVEELERLIRSLETQASEAEKEAAEVLKEKDDLEEKFRTVGAELASEKKRRIKAENDLDRRRKSLELRSADRGDVEVRNALLERRVEEATAESERLEAELASRTGELEKQRERVAGLEKVISALDARESEAQKEVEALRKEKREAERALEGLIKEFGSMEGERDAVNASAAELQSQRAALEERIADFEEERKRSEATRRELEENLRATEEKFKVAQERCGELQKEVESARVASPRTGSEDVAGRLRAAERERDGIREVLAKLDGRNRDLQRELERAERRLQSRGLDITPSPSEDGDDDRRRQIQAIDVLERKLDLTTRERDGYRDRCFVLEEEKLVLEGALATLESARADGARGAAAARPERGASSLGGSAAEELRTALREAEAEREMWRRKTEAALADLEAAREKTQEAAARRGALESELAEVRAKSPAGPQEAQERSGPGARRAEEALESEVAKLRALLEEKQAAATSAQDLLESKSAELRGLQRKFDEHQLDHSAFASQEAEVARLTSDLGAAKREMEVLRTNLYGAEVSVKKAAARHEEAEQQLEESERAAGALKEEVDRLSAALAAAESRAARAEEIERQLGKANEARDAAGLEVSRLERELREAERAATSSDTEDGSDAGASRAAELESQVAKLKALLEEERATAASARDALISHSSDLLSLKQTLEEEDRKHSEAAAAQQAEIERLEAGVAAAAREAEELRADRSKAEAFLKKASDGREAEFEERLAEVERSYAAQISQMDDRLAEAERRLEAAGAGAGAAAEMAAEAEKLREELAVAKTRAAQAEASVELTANAKASAEERERKLAARLREVEEECEAKMSRAAEECEERAKQAEEKCRIAEEEADRVLAKNMDMMIRLAMYE